jgi:chemosensory pili system protein ChpC
MANTISAQTPGAENDIRGVLIQVAGGRLLLPNATIAEVLSYAEPEAVADAPDWLLGRIRWRGWQLPLVAFGRLSGLAAERGGLGSKVVVLRALGGNPRAPYFALLTQGFPRLVTVSREALMVVEDNNPLPNGVQARVLLNEDAAFLPDLGVIEEQIGAALAQAA